MAPEGSSRITIEQWALVMEQQLRLSLDWVAMQPLLVQTVKRTAKAADGSLTLVDTGLVEPKKFLEYYAAELTQQARASGGGSGSGSGSGSARGGGGASGGGSGRGRSLRAQSKLAEVLCANHADLLTVFRHLDTDNDGKVSRAEWQLGVSKINQRLPESEQLPDLFDMLDLDGSGELELDEFTANVRRLSASRL